MQLRIAMKHPGLKSFEDAILGISTPGHSSYGNHLRIDEIRRLITPEEEATAAILQWLTSSGIPSNDIRNDTDWISLNLTVGQAERLLDTKYTWFYQQDSGISLVRTLQYSIPKNLHRYVHLIQPTTSLNTFQGGGSTLGRRKVKRFETSAHDAITNSSGTATNAMLPSANSCDNLITPACLIQIYNITRFNFTLPPNVTNKIGIAGFHDQFASQSDINSFLSTTAPNASGANFTFQGIDGSINQGGDAALASTEANLDIEYSVALAYPVNTTFYSTPGYAPIVPDIEEPNVNNPHNEPFLSLTSYLVNLPEDELPQVLMFSYGENEQSVPLGYANLVCEAFLLLGARGTSVIVASGDSGPGSACQTNNGTNATAYTPYFPAACPWVTTVGGTINPLNETAYDASGGGFSNYFGRPSYQDGIVDKYLEGLGNGNAGLYNASGRGYPDVAVQGQNFSFYDKGTSYTVQGTSIGPPIFGGMIAQINAARLATNQSALGFLNPWLYEASASDVSPFNDIVMGGSVGCYNRSRYSGLPAPAVPYAGWNATVGWDPVTGLGSPNFGKLLQTLNWSAILESSSDNITKSDPAIVQIFDMVGQAIPSAMV